MKKLTKIQLINWHLFSSQMIDIKNNTLISGENGAGKSTLLDALQYILIGGKSGTKFNIAANENAKRSLENYIRGKIGAENKEFLRNKDVIAHIALEFYSHKEKKYTILGCVLELAYKSLLKEKFYILNNNKLEKDTLISEDKPKNIQQIRNFFKQKDYKFDFFDTKKNYQQAMEKYLNINIQKYIKILPKALAFKPLNLQNFVFDFLLEESPINIASLKNSVQQLKKIEYQIEIEKKKLEKLKTIIECNQKIKLLKNQKKINFYVQKMTLVQKLNYDIKKYINQKEYLQIEIKDLLFQKEETSLYLDKINEKILRSKISQKEENLNNLFYSLKKDVIEKQNIIQELENKIFLAKKKIEENLDNLEKFFCLKKNFILEKNIKKIKNILDNIQIKDYSILQKYISEMSEILSKEKININIEKNDIDKNITELKKDIFQKKHNIEMINNILPSYNPNIIKLITIIKENICISGNKNTILPIHPLCELIEIKEELWRNAIEGILGKRKFNLIIDARFFDQSLNIYKKFQSTEKIYDVGIVNAEKIPYINENNKSLASKIKSNNKYALNYINLLLSNIICELETEKLKNHKTAITPEGMFYSNFTAQQLNPRTYKIPFIGMQSKQIRKKILTNEVEELEKELIQQREYFQQKEELLFLINRVNLSSLSVKDYILLNKKLSEYLIEIDDFKEKINKMEENNNIIDFASKIKEIQEDKKKTTNKINDILFNIAEKKNKINITDKKIILINEELSEIKKQLEEEEKKGIINIEAVQIQFKNYLLKYKNNYDIIFNQIKETILQIEKQKNKQQINIITQMNSYIEKYNLINVNAQIENIDYFIKEYNFINLKNLVHYEQEARELSFKIEIIFKEEFINKLKESLDNAEQQIEKLNKILKNRPFGNDYYQIITKPSDNIEYKKYYPIFTDKNSQKEINLFIDNINDYKKILLDELFQKIMSFKKEYEVLSYEFLDYRNYLSYDIQIQDKNGNLSLFSKVFREKSGGETQVPFYIIIAICFEQLLFENDYEKGCLVLFDEAFNNMDESRIDAMMSFLNELKIQFIIAVPPQRIINIIPHITTSLVIIKEDSFAIVENFTIEK
ncbi:ATP-binding protein [Candidatus Phytoplasma sacchari]|uniref:SbcC/MukB-like Walker B domain-containing protein n=1 Tax=Candidatus Phytoplasma sacchari TaxID=2609813 RepID=A0ABY7M3D6_9MOLU|nr:SbcC/MukB-like Walker B domain-containing protein [Candidatus Phytoplasma sacchari]